MLLQCALFPLSTRRPLYLDSLRGKNIRNAWVADWLGKYSDTRVGFDACKPHDRVRVCYDFIEAWEFQI